MSSIARHYAYNGTRRVHYRRAGEGPPLVMLHASPGSSLTLEPMMNRLSHSFTCIALDTSGFGETDPLPLTQPEIPDYADALADDLSALGLSKFDLYGTHTGAKIALELAVRHPERVRRLVLNGLAIYTNAERADYLANYLLPLEPEWDGSHLVHLWAMRRDMHIFSPWFKRTATRRQAQALPSADRLHAEVIDVLRSDDYRIGYSAAFRYDPTASLAQVQVPALLTATSGDSLSKHLDRLNDISPHITVEKMPQTNQQLDALAGRITEFLAGDSLPAAPPPAEVVPVAGSIRRDYVPSRVGQLLVRRSGVASGRPLVLMHASPYSGETMESLMLALGEDRPVITFDNPGNGDSASAPGLPEIGDLAAILGDGIDALGLTGYDLYGTHTGAMLAMEIAINRPQQVHRLICDGVTMYSPEKTQEILENYPIPMRVSSDGGHMIWGWNLLRDMALWFPWYDKTPACAFPNDLPTPEQLHERFRDWIKSGTTYHKSYRAAFAYPTAERLPLITVPTLHCTSPTDPLRAFLPAASQLTKNSVTAVHPGRRTPEAAAVSHSLYRRFLDEQPLPELPSE